MTILTVILYILTGTVLSTIVRASIFDRAVQTELTKLEKDIAKYPASNKKAYTEKQRIEYAIAEARRYAEAEWLIMGVLTFFFWFIMVPIFCLKRGIEWVVKKNFKFFNISKFETRLKKLDEIESLKARALEDKKKYDAAIKLLKDEGINIGE
jgi:hypothetical protein